MYELINNIKIVFFIKVIMSNNNDIILINKNEKKGAELLTTNSFFKDLIGIMKNTEFKNFYSKYFKDWTDIQTMIFYMKLYTTIEYEYNSRFSTQISDNLMTYTLHNVMTNTNTRSVAMSLFRDFKDLNHSRTYDFRTLIQFNNINTDTNELFIEN
jgi:hypothetical protein